jgi:hypothetical protein
MDALAVIDEIADPCWAMALAYEISIKMFEEVVHTPPSISDIKTVAREYGHWTFEATCDRYNETYLLVQAAIELCLLSFKASNTYTDRQRLFDRVAKSETFKANTDTNIFILDDGRKYSTSRIDLYQAYHTIHYPTNILYESGLNNNCTDTADLYEHFETTWSETFINVEAAKLHNSINTIAKEAGQC